MKMEEVDYISNLLKIASAKGTAEQAKTGKTLDEIEEILTVGAAAIQSKIIMLEAFRAVSIGDKKLIKKVVSVYNKLCVELGYKEG